MGRLAIACAAQHHLPPESTMRPDLSQETKDLLRRAVHVVRAASPADVAPSTAREYRRVADRIFARRRPDGSFPPLEQLTDSRAYYAQLRSAWSRHAHGELVEAISALRPPVPDADVRERLSRVRLWLAQAEAYPISRASDPLTERPGDRAPSRLTQRLASEGSRAAESRSKRRFLASLPHDWLDVLWGAAVAADHRHLDAIAVLICTGARPVEVGAGVLVERDGAGGLAFSIPGAKVGEIEGQPWRRLRVAAGQGAAAHLSRLTAGGPVLVTGPAPATLSTAIADLAGWRWSRRVSAYDIRHQRAADARNAFPGDVAACARWLGHAADTTLRYYGRLPRRAGCAGPVPLGAEAPRPVRRHLTAKRPELVAELG